MNRLLLWLTARLPCRIISADGTPYLERYHLGTAFGVRFSLHRFVGSDPAGAMHSHPWPWAVSLILSGWYYELTYDGLREVRWINWLTGKTFHRVVLPGEMVVVQTAPFPDLMPTYTVNELSTRPSPCWTLFCHRTTRTQEWGFVRREGDREIFTPHPSVSPDWWKTAPLGAAVDRQP